MGGAHEPAVDRQIVALSATLTSRCASSTGCRLRDKVSSWCVGRSGVPLHSESSTRRGVLGQLLHARPSAGQFLGDEYDASRQQMLPPRPPRTPRRPLAPTRRSRAAEKLAVGRQQCVDGAQKARHRPSTLRKRCFDMVRQLRSLDLFPSIVFVLSRRKCAELASLFCGGDHPDLTSPDPVCKDAVRKSVAVLRKRFLRRYEPVFASLPGVDDLFLMIDRGVAYHHSGMLPVLREFVEICFQNRLLRIVFSTETLAVGINMPARSVVFTQLTKPDEEGRSRPMRTDEFWQMAGRAGRRGMAQGYAVYEPSSCPVSKGCERCVPSSAAACPSYLASRLTGARLRHLYSGKHGPGGDRYLRTLASRNLAERAQTIEAEMEAICPSIAVEKMVLETYHTVSSQASVCPVTGLRPSARQRSAIDAKLRRLKHEHGQDLEERANQYRRWCQLDEDLTSIQKALSASGQRCRLALPQRYRQRQVTDAAGEGGCVCRRRPMQWAPFSQTGSTCSRTWSSPMSGVAGPLRRERGIAAADSTAERRREDGVETTTTTTTIGAGNQHARTELSSACTTSLPRRDLCWEVAGLR